MRTVILVMTYLVLTCISSALMFRAGYVRGKREVQK